MSTATRPASATRFRLADLDERRAMLGVRDAFKAIPKALKRKPAPEWRWWEINEAGAHEVTVYDQTAVMARAAYLKAEASNDPEQELVTLAHVDDYLKAFRAFVVYGTRRGMRTSMVGLTLGVTKECNEASEAVVRAALEPTQANEYAARVQCAEAKEILSRAEYELALARTGS